jgi:TPR repeat protein
MTPSVSHFAALVAALLLLSTTSLSRADDVASGASPGAPMALDAAAAERRGFEVQQKDPAEAVKWFTQGAKAGRPASQWALALIYFEGRGVPKDTGKTLELMRAAAGQGLAIAQSFLGWAYLEGSGVARDPQQAYAWLSAAARQEEPYALRMLAQFHASGFAARKDADLARRLLMRATELGDREAARAVSVMLLSGPSGQRDPERGIYILTKAAKAKDALAAMILGRVYLEGVHVPRNVPLAVQWLQSASDAGISLATLWLGELRLKGLGVARDVQRAEAMLKDGMAKATINEKNDFAWSLSVYPDEQLRDGALALRVLEPALSAEKERRAAHVDTLAAAYAEVRQFDKAVATQLLAIESARRERRPPEMVTGMEERLQLYRNGQPYREEAE